MVGSGEAKPDELAAEEDRHAETNIRLVGRAVVGRVVNDDVALLEGVSALLEELA